MRSARQIRNCDKQQNLNEQILQCGSSRSEWWMKQRTALVVENTNPPSRPAYLAAKPQCPGLPPPLPVIDTAACSEDLVCDPLYAFRTLDGTCSNLNYPYSGRAGNPYSRHLAARYSDGESEIRRSVRGFPLPNVRQLSSSLFPDRFAPSSRFTLNLMQWGQLVAHDTTHILNRQTEDSKTLKCCTNDNQLMPLNELPDDCLPMAVRPNDPFFSQFNVKCLDFARARLSDNGTCSFFPVEQLNVVTGVIDANMIYGNDDLLAATLRTFVGGELRVQLSDDGKEFPPNSLNPDVDCTNPPSEKFCYFSGDDRVNQNTDITVYHVVLLRFHNYLARELSQLNPQWSDESLYQEARRIVWAVMQHVTYKDFLPNILGKEYVNAKGLLIDNCYDCCINFYNPEVKPATFNEYGGAAFRSFHSLVPREVLFYNDGYQTIGGIFLDEYYFRPSIIQEDGMFDAMLRGLATQPQQSEDTFFSVTLTEFLYRPYNASFGNDMESTDIQRGRDHGLPTYNEMRELCGLRRAQNFQDFGDVMKQESVRKLQSFYTIVDDIDLFVGGMMEELIPGTLVGHTFQCIIGDQFYTFMRGDRFYYENCGLPTSFTRDQLDAIYQTTVAWIFCIVGDIHTIQYDTFQRPSYKNPRVPCSEIPPLDLRPWQELVL